MAQVYERNRIFNCPPPPISPSPSSHGVKGNFHIKLSPAVIIIIATVAVLFFISGLLHLLVRLLVKKPSSSSSGSEVVGHTEALQRQLHHLFHQHDGGLDQAFIDALPVFVYREILGGPPQAAEPFDCAVCLCEFREKDKLRLLPACGHAFHVGCIDTWLLSNSTCPLCRGTLFQPGSSVENPVFDYDDDVAPGDPAEKEITGGEEIVVAPEKWSLSVRLGKFCKVNSTGVGDDQVEAASSSSRLDARRCFSMGSYQYVVGDDNLRVAFDNNFRVKKPRDGEGHPLPPPPPHQASASCDGADGKRLSIGTKTDSFSISKIWIWSKKAKFGSSDSHVYV
ncbi:unnamed protein product [Cuscuta campestris]|uniref:RING-type E3 ubiquitin transferase n=1 Tax=Cuscuta campestris TaxID=132261 RepID=A0A484N9J0_9ASTE|nr:unnamed protein product [Cuscuta campestris]